MPMRSVPVQVSLNDKILPEEFRQFVEQGLVDSVTYYGMEYGMKGSCTVASKKEDKILIMQLIILS